MKNLTKNFINTGISMLKAELLGMSVPVYVCVAVTNRCNSDCVYCYRNKETSQDISTDGIKSLIDQTARAGCRIMWFSGGEPLLRGDIIELAKYAKQKGLSARLATNGYLLPEKKEIIGIADQIYISLDGPEKMHDANKGPGSFRKTMRAIEEASGKTVLWTNTVITRHNVDCVDFILQKAGEYGFKAGFSIVRGKKELKPGAEEYRNVYSRLISEKKRGSAVSQSYRCLGALLTWPDYEKDVYSADEFSPGVKCLAGKTNCLVNYDGNVYPCSELIGKVSSLNYLQKGFKASFEHLKKGFVAGCAVCDVSDYIESNYLYALNPEALHNRLRALLSMKTNARQRINK